MTVDININRLYYLLQLYQLSIEDLLSYINEGLKKSITVKDIDKSEINLNHLKRIDKIFNKGINFYLNPKSVKNTKDESIFFRKDSFNSELNLEARRIVNHFEDEKIYLSALSQLSELKIKRKFPVYKLTSDPNEVANKARKDLYPSFNTDQREFLKLLISNFASLDILVFEFVETWNKKEKANINGFYLSPNVIVLKRQQRSFRREIFTLIHELGHYLLNKEEIENVQFYYSKNDQVSDIERWCNEFAYYFLAGDNDQIISILESPSSRNDYQDEEISNISRRTHLSKLAIYTRLAITNRMSWSNYSLVRKEILASYELKLEEEKSKKILDKQRGIQTGGSTPKPIKSPLLVNTITSAFYEGIIGEAELCKKLKIKPSQVELYLQ